MAISTSQRLLRRLGGLGRQLFSAQSFATDVTQSGTADLALVQTNSGTNSCSSRQALMYRFVGQLTPLNLTCRAGTSCATLVAFHSADAAASNQIVCCTWCDTQQSASSLEVSCRAHGP